MRIGKCAGCEKVGANYEPRHAESQSAFDAVESMLNTDPQEANLARGSDGKILPALFTFHDTEVCFICLCKLQSTCVACLTDVDVLFIDKRCKNSPYVCSDCLKLERTNHLNACYADGCMTPGELAQEELEIMLEEERLYREELNDEEWKNV